MTDGEACACTARSVGMMTHRIGSESDNWKEWCEIAEPKSVRRGTVPLIICGVEREHGGNQGVVCLYPSIA